MPSTKTFEGVSLKCFQCTQEATATQHHTVFDPPPPATKGSAVTKTPIGDIKLDFDYDETSQSVTYTLNHKPFVLPEGQLWDGIEDAIKKCGGGS